MADIDRRRLALENRSLALSKIDDAPFSWVDVRGILVTGVGFFTDAYQLFAVAFAVVMFAHVYNPDTGDLAPSSETAIKIASSVGTVIGQFGFGFLSDRLGRKKMYGVELVIMIAATFSLAISGSGPRLNIIGITVFWRVILGIGVGGDYPSSSIITSEFAAVSRRGAMMASVFANQGLGQFTAALISFLCAAGYRSSLEVSVCGPDCQAALDQSWRILYGLGIVPACIALYFRLTIPESIRFTLDVKVNASAAVADAERYVSGAFGPAKRVRRQQKLREIMPKASFRDFRRYFGTWKTGKVLLGTAGSWAFLDVAFYGIELNTSLILRAIGYAGDDEPTIYQQLYNLGVGNLILSVAGLIPGHIVAILLIDRVGRKPLQIGGFIILTIFFCVIGFAWFSLSPVALFVLFCLCNFISNVGPNTTTFIVPGEVFPTRYRSTAYGISAGCGKIGSIISQAIFGPLKDRDGKEDNWVNSVMQIYALFMFLGIFTSFLIPETKRIPLEKLTGESIEAQFEMEAIDDEDEREDSDDESEEV